VPMVLQQVSNSPTNTSGKILRNRTMHCFIFIVNNMFALYLIHTLFLYYLLDIPGENVYDAREWWDEFMKIVTSKGEPGRIAV
jgi:hypothetical protein